MSERERLLSALNRPVTLQSGATVTIRAWGLDFVEQNTQEFFAFLRLFVQGVRGQDLNTQPQALGLLARVARASLVKEEDAELLTVADLPELGREIFSLNRLGDVAGGLIGLLTMAQQAVNEAASLQDVPSPSPN